MHTQPSASPITPGPAPPTRNPAASRSAPAVYKYWEFLAVMGIASSSSSNPETVAMALAKAQEVAASAPVVVFSKSYCPFCTKVKQLFTKLGASFKAIELDVESDGADVQSALAQWTGQRTVPNVFINGKHIGGCDDTLALEKSGKLVPLLREAGAISGSDSKTTMTA